MTDPALRGRSRLNDDVLARRVRHLAADWIALPLGEVTDGRRAESFGTASFGPYTTGGVAIPDMTGAADVSMVPWTDGAGAVYLFKWDAANSRMIVTDWTGTEIADTTDLSAIADHPFHAVLSGVVTPRYEVRLRGAGRILDFEIEVHEDFTASDTNYWTLTGYLRRMNQIRPQDVGETLGTVSTQRLTLVAQKPEALYLGLRGTAYADSDRVSIVATPTGNPGALVGAIGWVHVARNAA